MGILILIDAHLLQAISTLAIIQCHVAAETLSINFFFILKL